MVFFSIVYFSMSACMGWLIGSGVFSGDPWMALLLYAVGMFVGVASSEICKRREK